MQNARLFGAKRNTNCCFLHHEELLLTHPTPNLLRLFEAKIVLEEEKFRRGEQPLEELSYYRYRYWIRLRSILALLSAIFMGGGGFFIEISK